MTRSSTACKSATDVPSRFHRQKQIAMRVGSKRSGRCMGGFRLATWQPMVLNSPCARSHLLLLFA